VREWWLTLVTLALASTGTARAAAPADVNSGAGDTLSEVVVTAERRELIGNTSTASEGIVVNDELALTPAYRPGQLLETVPGLQVTSHSGEGKANQYLMRGYNLDHGTDLAVSIEGMPVNNPTHAHGQGYTDLNFMVPELATNIKFTKGTYYANRGDFASVGSIHLSYLDRIENQLAVTGGNFGFRRLFTAGSAAAAAGNILGALELQSYDGPWDSPDDQRKVNAVLRYSNADACSDRRALQASQKCSSSSLTAMFYHGLWNATTDQPDRAVQQGLIGRFGTLDPSDGGQAQRWSVSGQHQAAVAAGLLEANAYVVNTRLTLWNNFTHFLTDPVNGDQEAQTENRYITGAGVSYQLPVQIAGITTEWLGGAQVRYDINDLSRLPSAGRAVLPSAHDPLNFSETDDVHLLDLSGYAQATTRWTPWFRSVLGIRADHIHGIDSGTNSGRASDSLLQPKISLVFTPADTTELYLSAGRGFHSDDLRGVTQAAATGQPGAPLIARQRGEEFGVRQQLAQDKIAITLAVFNLDAESETTYDPDAGEDGAGPASRRCGFEVNLTYQALKWLEFYASYSADHARFTRDFDDGTGHISRYLPNAPFATGSFNVYVKNLGPLSGGLEYRYLGREPLSPDDQVQSGGYGEWNADVRFAFAPDWSAGLGVYNILNRHANAAEFWYVDRLRGEPVDGIPDLHAHPLEPIAVRLMLSKTF
jgi:outer membrane receptor protein involved in Fe transport